MKPTISALGLIAPLAIFALDFGAAHAQANDMFPTKAAAEKRAKELKCSGAFAMAVNGCPVRTLTFTKKLPKRSRSGTHCSLVGCEGQVDAERIISPVATVDDQCIGDITTVCILSKRPHARHVRHKAGG
jgi:hypothetical protein